MIGGVKAKRHSRISIPPSIRFDGGMESGVERSVTSEREEGRSAESGAPGAVAARLPTAAPTFWGVMRHVHYRNMLGAQFVSNIGGWMEMFGMQWLVAAKTGSLRAMGFLGAAQLIPIMLFGIPGGVVADRVNRKKLLIVTQTMLMLVAAVVALLSYLEFPAGGWWMDVCQAAGRMMGSTKSPEYVVPLMILGAINGTIMAFNMPAWQVLTPRLVPREELTAAITLNGIQFNLSRMVGPGVAGVIMAWQGATPLFIFNTLSFLGVVLTATTTPDAPAPARRNQHPWHEVREAARFVMHEPGPRAVFLAMTMMSLLAAPLVRVLPLFVMDVYGLPEKDAEGVSSLLLALQGIGAVAGGLSLKFIPRWYPKHHFIPMAVMCAGLSISAFAATSTVWSGYIAMLVCGFFWIWAFNQSWAAMQHLVTDVMRGRVLALANVFAFGATALGSVVLGWIGDGLKQVHGGPLTDARATQVSILTLSLPLFIAGIVMLSYRTPEVDGMPRRLADGTRPTRNFIKAILGSEHKPRPAAEETDAAGRL